MGRFIVFNLLLVVFAVVATLITKQSLNLTIHDIVTLNVVFTLWFIVDKADDILTYLKKRDEK